MRALERNETLLTLAANFTRIAMIERLWTLDMQREARARALTTERKRKQRALDAVLGRRSDGHTIRPIIGR